MDIKITSENLNRRNFSTLHNKKVSISFEFTQDGVLKFSRILVDFKDLKENDNIEQYIINKINEKII